MEQTVHEAKKKKKKAEHEDVGRTIASSEVDLLLECQLCNESPGTLDGLSPCTCPAH